MNKQIVFDKNAFKEFSKFLEPVQEELEALIGVLEETGRLEFPEARKIDKNLFELRLKFKGEYRGFYTYISKNQIIILHFFRKKTQKTPIKNIKTAKRRLKYYE